MTASALPPRPNLENLKNQAKTLLKRFKDHDPGVCGLFRHLHRFAAAGDEAILAAAVSLADVQFALAIEYGFPDWKTLKKHVESASPPIEPAGTEPGPARRVVVEIVKEAVKAGASDSHFEWSGRRLGVRQRVGGLLRASEVAIPEAQQEAVIDDLKRMGALDTARHDLPQTGQVMLEIDGRSIIARISVVPYVTGESVVVRYLPKIAPGSLDLGAQDWAEGDLKRFREWLSRPNGLIVVTGPTGSGKTTTVYAALKETAVSSQKVVTAEDPVEYVLEGVQQHGIDPAKGITYAQAIRNLLRQDPDVMMVGEVLDPETLEMLLLVAMSGHLAITQMHAEDGPACLRRMLDLRAEPFLINKGLLGVLAQRVVRRLCPDCRRQVDPPAWLAGSVPDLPPGPIFASTGCDACRGSGYRGQAAIHALLEMDEGLRTVVASGGTLDDLRRQAAAGSGRTLRQTGLALAAQGITTIDEVLRVCPP